MWATTRTITGAIAAALGLAGAISTFVDFATSGKVNVILVTIGGLACALAIALFAAVAKKATNGIIWTTPARFAFGSSILGTIALIIIVIFSGIALASTNSTTPVMPTQSSTPPTTTIAPSPVPTPATTAPAPDATAQISTPADGSLIQPGQDVNLAGTAGGLGDRDFWIVSRADSADELYSIIVPAPLTLSSGKWSVTDQSVGDQTDRGHAISFITVAASHACSTALEHTPSDQDGVMSFRALPDGCTVIGNPINVNMPR